MDDKNNAGPILLTWVRIFSNRCNMKLTRSCFLPQNNCTCGSTMHSINRACSSH